IRRTYQEVNQADALWHHIRDAAHLSDSGQDALLPRHIRPDLRGRRFLLTPRPLGPPPPARRPPPPHATAVPPDIPARALHALRRRRFLLPLRDLGAATYALGTPPKDVRAVLHDIRGGALLALIGYAAAESRGDAVSDAERATVILRARDHARLMRNAVSD